MGCRDKGAASCPPARPKAAGADRQELTSCRARPFGETPAALVEAGPSPQEMVDLGLARAPAEADPDRRGSDLWIDPHRGQHVAWPNFARRAGGAGTNHDPVEIEGDDLGLGGDARHRG